MNEYIKTGVVFILVILAAIMVITTRGNDELDMKIDFDFSTEEDFVYAIDTSNNALNGEYKRNTGDYKYFMVGKNPDSNTYRLYFIQVGSAVFGSTTKNVVLRVDDLKIDGNGMGKFTTDNGAGMKITFSDKMAIVASDMSLGDASIEGTYIRQKGISTFSLSQFTIFK